MQAIESGWQFLTPAEKSDARSEILFSLCRCNLSRFRERWFYWQPRCVKLCLVGLLILRLWTASLIGWIWDREFVNVPRNFTFVYSYVHWLDVGDEIGVKVPPYQTRGVNQYVVIFLDFFDFLITDMISFSFFLNFSWFFLDFFFIRTFLAIPTFLTNNPPECSIHYNNFAFESPPGQRRGNGLKELNIWEITKLMMSSQVNTRKNCYLSLDIFKVNWTYTIKSEITQDDARLSDVTAGSFIGDLIKKEQNASFNQNGSRISKEKILPNFLPHYGYGLCKETLAFKTACKILLRKRNQTSNWKFKLSLTFLGISNIA